MEKTWRCPNLKEDKLSWIIDTEVVIFLGDFFLKYRNVCRGILFNFVFSKCRYGYLGKKKTIFYTSTNAVKIYYKGIKKIFSYRNLAKKSYKQTVAIKYKVSWRFIERMKRFVRRIWIRFTNIHFLQTNLGINIFAFISNRKTWFFTFQLF